METRAERSAPMKRIIKRCAALAWCATMAITLPAQTETAAGYTGWHHESESEGCPHVCVGSAGRFYQGVLAWRWRMRRP
jgi:hypothetical protein